MVSNVNVPLAALTAQVVSAFVRNREVAAEDLPALIRSIHGKFLQLSMGEVVEPREPEANVPAVPIRKSVTADYLICLEDGKKLKMLKRHLMTRYGMTAEEYREKWNLPRDYPMVAPNYARSRSEIAYRLGLGRRGPKATDAREVGTAI